MTKIFGIFQAGNNTAGYINTKRFRNKYFNYIKKLNLFAF